MHILLPDVNITCWTSQYYLCLTCVYWHISQIQTFSLFLISLHFCIQYKWHLWLRKHEHSLVMKSLHCLYISCCSSYCMLLQEFYMSLIQLLFVWQTSACMWLHRKLWCDRWCQLGQNCMYISPCPSSQTSKIKVLVRTNACWSSHSSGSQSLASHRGGLGSIPGHLMDLQWTEWLWCRFSPSTSVSPVSTHPTSCSIFIAHPSTSAIWSWYWLLNKQTNTSVLKEQSTFCSGRIYLVIKFRRFLCLEN
jgi:hypothetical protein